MGVSAVFDIRATAEITDHHFNFEMIYGAGGGNIHAGELDSGIENAEIQQLKLGEIQSSYLQESKISKKISKKLLYNGGAKVYYNNSRIQTCCQFAQNNISQ